MITPDNEPSFLPPNIIAEPVFIPPVIPARPDMFIVVAYHGSNHYWAIPSSMRQTYDSYLEAEEKLRYLGDCWSGIHIVKIPGTQLANMCERHGS